MDSKAVSPLIGFILLMAIIMGLIGILQSTAVPQWNRAVESGHLSSLKYEVADISKVVSISASTGNPAKVVLNAGVKYPNYYILFSPSKASTTISSKNLSVNISSINNPSHNIQDQSSAMIVEPNYYYSSKSKLIYEHSAVLRKELNGIVLAESDQSAFNDNSIHLTIIKANFGSFATTETASLILVPESYGGSQLFSGSIEFESYDESTAEWWNKTLGRIYGEDNVTVSDNKVSLKVQNVSLSISVFSAYAVSSGEIIANPGTSGLNLVQISQNDFSIYFGSTVILAAKTIDDYGNPVRNALVSISDSCNGYSSQNSDERGFVIYYFNANCIGSQSVTFSVGGDTLNFNINVQASPSSGGGGGGTFTLYWYNNTSEAPINDYTWDVRDMSNQTRFYVRVTFEENPVSNLPVYFAFNKSTIISVNDKSVATDANGYAFINLTANMNGSVAVVAIASDSSARLNITITNVTLGNLPPTQPNVQTDKRYYRSMETIVASASGSTDPDGDPITYYYRFYDLNLGNILRDWDTSNTYVVTTSEEGHIIRVFAKACDDSNACSVENYVDVGVIKVIEIRNVTYIYDTYVRSGQPNSNYGTSTTIYAGYSTSISWGVTRILIKFDLPSELSDKRVFNATLYLYKTGHTGTPTNIQLGAHRVTSAWSETTATWNNQPNFATSATSSITPPTQNNLYLAWNVTSDVQLFADGTTNYGWCIKSSNENQSTRVNFASKESTNVNKPYLRIEYAPRVD